MVPRGFSLMMMAVMLMVGPSTGHQAPQLNSSQLTAFIGTWVFDMTEPRELVGSTETVRIFEKSGVVAASVQVGRFPPNDATGILMDGDLLVLTTTMRENGVPIWVVVSLKRSGETLTLAQMMERSRTIKRGTGKKQTG
jgi:hypothetical protein